MPTPLPSLSDTAVSVLATRFPVGVVTGVLGAPYLIYLIIRTNRAGSSL